MSNSARNAPVSHPAHRMRLTRRAMLHRTTPTGRGEAMQTFHDKRRNLPVTYATSAPMLLYASFHATLQC
ncbi:hypothetical protein X946_3579 [Burkholderia sp. ABCPW 111]|nr:hypothetical protein X946_3579 [Burkholderia sp. ABCPW 111]